MQTINEEANRWFEAGMISPTFMVLEMCRITGLPPMPVIKYLISPDSIASPIGLVNQDPRKWLKEVQTPSPSKRRDKIISGIQKERQRFQRRPQFPNSSVPKTTRRKADNLTAKYQMERVRFRLKSDEEVSEQKSQGRKKARDEMKRKFEIRWMSKARGPQIKATRQGMKEAGEKSSKLLDILSSSSVMSPQRPSKIKELATQAVLTRDPFIVINWICPASTPRKLAPDASGIWRSYLGINQKAGFEKDYLLLPRLNLEKKLIRAFERTGVPFLYLKLVADDNPYCLYPYCLKKDGEQKTMEEIASYARYVQERLNRELGKGKIIVWTVSEFLGKERFRRLIRLFDDISIEELLPFLPQNIVDTEMEIITKSSTFGPELQPFLESFSKLYIRQYAAEGLIIREMLGDNVIIAWNESTRRNSTIDAGLKSKGFDPFPKIYVLYNERS